jgi:AraC-like DNA-binding protein
MKDYSLYEIMDMPHPDFPIKIHKISSSTPDLLFPSHWHEHLELLYFIKGKALIECNQQPFEVSPGDLVVVNSNELHYGENISDSLFYYCVILDISLLTGVSSDAVQTRYISPISQNRILFKNRIEENDTVKECILNMIREYDQKNIGFELEIKSSIYHLLALLLRHYVEKTLTTGEYDLRAKNLERFYRIFKYIEANYTEKISIHDCAAMLNITDSHFCHLFKLITGKSLSDYVNYLRLKKAETLLRNTSLSITEIALESGFNDINYFSRLFGRYKNTSPSKYRKEL